ncbi:BRO1-like domain-domain-containing protein [Syncephalastrum racemosum]|uniref:BRO domain-containing protein 1 n=1 Tax=Syncephalastrum racemosum TaxID=13706 RepID=A0A1X2HTY3_SYNRA|nr:BRO1-like domain-domain-containing protein [Syncephalastrum racemosum]
MAQAQVPLLSAPFKRTSDVDWVSPLKQYIARVYQDDPEKYSEETYALNRLRQDTRGAGKDTTGRDLLYRYFGQLELLDLRFPVDEKHVKILFTWYDAFNGQSISQYSLAYEKAGVLFNIAATLSAVASTQNRAEAEGRKVAFNYFQAAAGMFCYINDNFLHAPSQDLSRDVVKLLADLMLAQAHECFIENSCREKKKDTLIAKLASHAAWAYASLADAILDVTSHGCSIEKSWLTACQTKQKYYNAIAQLHKAAACQADAQYGEQVARLAVAEQSAKEGIKLGTTLASQSASSGHANGTLPPDSGGALQELCKALNASAAELGAAATRDNDMIYHDMVPQESILKPIDRLQAVKPIPISELYANVDINKVIGTDIFARLVPLSVHESASLYSEEKAKLVRAESERCDLAKAELTTTLEYMKLPATLETFRRKDISQHKGPSQEVCDWADTIHQEESRTPFKDLLDQLEMFKRQSVHHLDKITLALDQEMRECENMRVKYEGWSQAPSAQVASDFRADMRNHRQTLEQAAQSDNQLLRRYDAIHADIHLLQQGSKSSELARAFETNISPPKGESLLDLDFDPPSSDNTQRDIEKVEAALEKLRRIEQERIATLDDLREKSLQDDISHILILNKKTAQIEEQIFNQELEKYRPHQQRISATIERQQQLIQELTQAYKALMENTEAKAMQSHAGELERTQRQVTERLQTVKSEYLEIKESLRQGVQFYRNLSNALDGLLTNVQRFARQREDERQKLIEALDAQQSAREQAVIKDKLNAFAPPEVNPRFAGTVSQLVDQARELSLNPSAPPGTSAYSAASESRGASGAGVRGGEESQGGEVLGNGPSGAPPRLHLASPYTAYPSSPAHHAYAPSPTHASAPPVPPPVPTAYAQKQQPPLPPKPGQQQFDPYGGRHQGSASSEYYNAPPSQSPYPASTFESSSPNHGGYYNPGPPQQQQRQQATYFSGYSSQPTQAPLLQHHANMAPMFYQQQQQQQPVSYAQTPLMPQQVRHPKPESQYPGSYWPHQQQQQQQQQQPPH